MQIHFVPASCLIFVNLRIKEYIYYIEYRQIGIRVSIINPKRICCNFRESSTLISTYLNDKQVKFYIYYIYKKVFYRIMKWVNIVNNVPGTLQVCMYRLQRYFVKNIDYCIIPRYLKVQLVLLEVCNQNTYSYTYL